jgi:hypothetical protein
LNPVTFIGTRSIFVAFAIANKRNTTYITPFDYVLVGTPRTETHPLYEDTSVTLLKYYSTITFYVIAYRGRLLCHHSTTCVNIVFERH